MTLDENPYAEPASTPGHRLMSRIEVRPPSDCWVWTGALRNGYGVISVNRRMVYTHRLSYELHVGPIPAGLQIDHLCRNRLCINPDHLEAVTQAENIRRSNEALGRGEYTTHCPAGHPYDDENTDVRGGKRYCRSCAGRRQAVARTCECCGEPFATTRSLKRFCSRACKHRARRARAAA